VLQLAERRGARRPDAPEESKVRIPRHFHALESGSGPTAQDGRGPMEPYR
jgi:hypothetical protein